VYEWSRVAERYAARGRPLEASRRWNMARFPFVDGPARQQALDRCVAAFDQWRRSSTDIEPLDVGLDGLDGGGRVRGWASGLAPATAAGPGVDRRPVLLIMGGIVTPKEQWAPALAALRRWGMAVVATELPRVGQNTLRYTPESWRMLSGLLDAIADRADVSRTYALALSFAGHLALRCAVEDRRIRGVVTTGAPVRELFTDAGWQRRLPRITRDTLAHLTGIPVAELPGRLGGWALSADQLASLDIPVYYAASDRDEIIPAGEVQLLRQHVRDLHLVRQDDVHGSPAHTTENRLWTAWSVLQMSGRLPVRRTLLRAVLATLRARRWRPAAGNGRVRADRADRAGRAGRAGTRR